MKTLLDLIRQPLFIGVFVLSTIIVVGAYFGSHWYYGDIAPFDIPESSTFTPSLPEVGQGPEVNLEGLQVESEPTPIESDTTVTPLVVESVEDFLVGLSPEEIQLLTEEVVEELPPRESPHGFGPYPDVPSDYPRQNIWGELERFNDIVGEKFGRSSLDHELIHRVLIKLWNQGKKAEGAILDGDNGRVYPMYKDTVYVSWSESENEDGSFETYLSSYSCHPTLKDYRDSVENGTQPSWIKVVLHEEDGIAPYSFLDLP